MAAGTWLALKGQLWVEGCWRLTFLLLRMEESTPGCEATQGKAEAAVAKVVRAMVVERMFAVVDVMERRRMEEEEAEKREREVEKMR